MDYNADAFNSVCVKSQGGALKPLVIGLINAATSFVRSADSYLKTVKADKSAYNDEDVFDCYTKKCTALIDNVDMLPAWCMYIVYAAEADEITA